MYVTNNLSIIVFLFYMILLLIQLCISWCRPTYYIMYNIKIINVYKIRLSQQNMYIITVDFPQINISHLLIMYNNLLFLSKKIVCIAFSRIFSQQHSGSDVLRYKVFVIAIRHYHKFMHYRSIGVAENES